MTFRYPDPQLAADLRQQAARARRFAKRLMTNRAVAEKLWELAMNLETQATALEEQAGAGSPISDSR